MPDIPHIVEEVTCPRPVGVYLHKPLNNIIYIPTKLGLYNNYIHYYELTSFDTVSYTLLKCIIY